jgi:hypothetical protein
LRLSQGHCQDFYFLNQAMQRFVLNFTSSGICFVRELVFGLFALGVSATSAVLVAARLFGRGISIYFAKF